jgi:hypothetical protein
MSAENQTPDQPRPAMPIAAFASVVAIVLRVVRHPPGLWGVGALGLFGGARLRLWHAMALTLATMVVSDLLLWAFTGLDFKYSLGHPSRLYVYPSFLIYVLIGRLLRNKHSLGSIACAALAGSLQFFLVTNFCEWLFQPWQPGYDDLPDIYRYSRDLNGLVSCFTLALPFYQGEMPYTAHPFMLFRDFRLSLFWSCLGDVFFATVYFSAYAKFAKAAPGETQMAARA